MVKERPILFSDQMVRAILNDQNPKTQTRRLVKKVPTVIHLPTQEIRQVTPLAHQCPFGAPGDRLWVRETWGYDQDGPHTGPLVYRATDPEPNAYRWRPSIHMRRSDSRIDLEIVKVRAERLQDITDADARAEGVLLDVDRRRAEAEAYNKQYPRTPVPVGWAIVQKPDDTYRNAFHQVWTQINGTRAPWEANPWVWVVEFRRIRP
jgi:hypothetical protein